MKSKFLFRACLCLALLPFCLHAADDAALKARVQARAAAVGALRSSGLVRESSDGHLAAAGTLDAQQLQTMNDENRDRDLVFANIASESHLTAPEVAAMFADRAQRLNHSAVAMGGNNTCALRPALAMDVSKLLQYLKQGMSYSSQNKPDMALNEFEQVRKIDPNFLGAEMNIGSAYMLQRKYSDAENAFAKELKLIGCMQPMDDAQLGAYGYMLEVAGGAASTGGRAAALRSNLKKDEAETHYNLACAHAQQNDKAAAIEELRKATADGLIPKKSLQTDPDLKNLRGNSEFMRLLNDYSPAGSKA